MINPSAENLAKYFYDETTRQMNAMPEGARITSITIWETDTTSATYWSSEQSACGFVESVQRRRLKRLLPLNKSLPHHHLAGDRRGTRLHLRASWLGYTLEPFRFMARLAGADRRGDSGAAPPTSQKIPRGTASQQRHDDHRNIPVDSGRGHARRPAVHFRASHRMQSALHLVRHRVRVSRRHENERRGSFRARGGTVDRRRRRYNAGALPEFRKSFHWWN